MTNITCEHCGTVNKYRAIWKDSLNEEALKKARQCRKCGRDLFDQRFGNVLPV